MNPDRTTSRAERRERMRLMDNINRLMDALGAREIKGSEQGYAQDTRASNNGRTSGERKGTNHV